MARRVSILIAISTLGLSLSVCTSSVPSAPGSDSAGTATTPRVTESAGDALLREQKRKLDDIRREYEDCKDLGDYARMIKLARARRAELEIVIRQIHEMKLSPEDHERILNPLRQERDWHLQVIEAASAM